jgi:hypothetical protein
MILRLKSDRHYTEYTPCYFKSRLRLGLGGVFLILSVPKWSNLEKFLDILVVPHPPNAMIQLPVLYCRF